MLKKIEKINGENGKFALVKYTSLEKCNNKKILIVPDFGKKGDHYFDLIYYLAFNGYAVTCLETENNVGEGDGYITNASLCIYEQNLKKVLKGERFDFLFTEKISVFYVIESVIKMLVKPKIIMINLVESLKSQIKNEIDKIKLLNGFVITEPLLDGWSGCADIYSVFELIQLKNIDCTIIYSKNDQVIEENKKYISTVHLKCLNYFVEDIFKNPVITMEFYYHILETLNGYSNITSKIDVPSYMSIIEVFDKIDN